MPGTTTLTDDALALVEGWSLRLDIRARDRVERTSTSAAFDDPVGEESPADGLCSASPALRRDVIEVDVLRSRPRHRSLSYHRLV